MNWNALAWYAVGSVSLGCLLIVRAAIAQPSHCQALIQRMYELEALVTQHEQAATQASEQARSACRGTSMVDCSYWSSLARGLHRNARDFVHERARIQMQLAQLGCR